MAQLVVLTQIKRVLNARNCVLAYCPSQSETIVVLRSLVEDSRAICGLQILT